MKKYTFGNVEKTLKRNTFELEENVKDAIGANEKNQVKLENLNKEFERISKEYAAKPNKKRKVEIEKRILEINNEVVSLTNDIKWSNTFDGCIKVMDILLVEGSAGLTKQNFGRFDAEGVWNDFFTSPQARSDD